MSKKSKTENIKEEEKNMAAETTQESNQTEVLDEVSVEEKLTNDLAQEKDKFLRLFAEFENYKKRTARERLDLIETAGSSVMLSILPVLDDFERALSHIEEDKEAEELRKGVVLIYQKLLTTLGQKGLKEMESKGKDFDPDFHQALTEIEATSKKMKGKVVDVIEKGYFIGDKILRHAKVVVGK
ncbi:MAG: nucleotide exchange factor GrpE [Bacteroidia bacterium]|nr:nucleotide exchange factor GrpE [Bacteroidia bacterium]NND10371.1 nucleotide exchange factor GrpE [Flavobacteriaceae bacterium]NNK28679.1 nucleotide exchange factor GrpE [Flavobacteriaceae bacterium]